VTAALEALFRSALGAAGPQRLRHTLVTAQRHTASTSNNEKPA